MNFIEEINSKVVNIMSISLDGSVFNNPKQEMINFYEKRTNDHIDRVRKNLVKMEGYRGLSLDHLKDRGDRHDISKFSKIEKIPYVWLSWFYKCKKENIPFKYPSGVEEKVNSASEIHVRSNRHHPEAHEDIHGIDGMSLMDIVEMVCDWTAMSQEYGQDGGSSKGWADKNVGSKWKFNEGNTDLIYDVIKELDKRNGIGQ